MNFIKMNKKKNIALIAHDNRKDDLVRWINNNKDKLKNHNLFGTGTTAKIIKDKTGLNVKGFNSGPLGGDQQIGARIVEGYIDFMIFFWDPMTSQPHDPDVKALLRIGVLYDIPVASNQATADFLFSSELIGEVYNRRVIDYSRRID